VLWQLRREYPDATVNKLPKFTYPEIASVLYSQLPDKSSEWLKKLGDCGVVVSHVVTSTQLLSDLFRDYPYPVLLHMFDGNSRHRLLLTVDGMPLHMRQAVDVSTRGSQVGSSANVDVGDNSFAQNYLCESIEYLSESVFSSFKDVLVVLPRGLTEAESPDFPDEYLAKHLLGLQCKLFYQHISFFNGSGDEISPLIGVDSLNKGFLSEIIINKALTSKYKHAMHMCFLKKLKSYAVTCNPAKFSNIFERSIAAVNDRRCALMLRRCALIFFLVFLFVVLASSRSGVRSIQEQAKFSDEHAILKINLRKLKQHATTLHASPFFAMNSVNRIQAFEKAAIPAPLQIMSAVAAAVKDSPSVSLTGFAWSVVDESSDTTHVTINSVSIRDSYWDEYSSHSKTMIEMSGQLVSESGLRQKQIQLNNFLSVLSESKNISPLRVIDSPANSASSSHLMSESKSAFRIQFSIEPI
jgi:fumarate reductase subunit C